METFPTLFPRLGKKSSAPTPAICADRAEARNRRLFRIFGALLSGALLFAAFPPLEWSALAWIAWVPLVFSVRNRGAREAARLGILAGLVFWMCSIHWLTRVTAAGWFGLTLYSSLYFVPFCVFVAGWTRKMGMTSPVACLGLVLGGTFVWTGSESLRYVLFTGFPWNAAGVSQYANIPLIQIASVGGVFAVTAMILLANLGTVCLLAQLRSERKTAMSVFSLTLLAVVGVSLFGMQSARRRLPPDDQVRIALIQPAISQYEKWTPAFMRLIYDRLRTLSETALRAGRPDLLVWPETAVPESIMLGGESYELVRDLSAKGTPMLVGSVETALGRNGVPGYFNRSLLLGPDVSVLGYYDKQHLVLYGEYVPFSEQFPILRSLTPMESDVTAGAGPVALQLPGKSLLFSVLICFEDAIPRLGRTAARAGARMLINQTNDAWFDVSSASRQHWAQAVFRCVETRLPMARCGNTGLTGWIDEIGRPGGSGARGSGLLPHVSPEGEMLSGFLTVEIPYRASAPRLPFYVRQGHWVDGIWIAGASLFLLTTLRRRPG
ncbi:MAG: apolipoprotein N-acyltransferase [Kiritimatiellia bacterium]|nr:apolipoprotein N-acyltransferase [Kiritimatiellia bacterium]